MLTPGAPAYEIDLADDEGRRWAGVIAAEREIAARLAREAAAEFESVPELLRWAFARLYERLLHRLRRREGRGVRHRADADEIGGPRPVGPRAGPGEPPRRGDLRGEQREDPRGRGGRGGVLARRERPPGRPAVRGAVGRGLAVLPRRRRGGDRRPLCAQSSHVSADGLLPRPRRGPGVAGRSVIRAGPHSCRFARIRGPRNLVDAAPPRRYPDAAFQTSRSSQARLVCSAIRRTA